MLSPLLIEETVRAALREDLGHGHDITAQTVIPGDAEAAAVIRSRGNGILAGLIPCLTAFSLTDPDFDFEIMLQDGDLLEPGDIIARISGPARPLLTAERTGLNFLTMMSGIASLTAVYVHQVRDTAAQICDTRKTLPGLRAFQKYAVKIGGGVNHRFGLDDAILIKDNHIAIAGGVHEALSAAKDGAGHTVKIEIEVDSLPQLEEVLTHGGADIVMLDNMNLNQLKKAVKMRGDGVNITPSPILEASGGVTLESVRAIAETGVDYISVGALTHSAPALDVGLDFLDE